MAYRRPNPRLVKIHQPYTVAEIAERLQVHRNTVRNWLATGLRTTDDKLPFLIRGQDLADFLNRRRARNRRTCQPGQLFCVRCREPRSAAGGMADYQPITETVGNLVALCVVCETWMNRRVSRSKLDQVRGKLEITMLFPAP